MAKRKNPHEAKIIGDRLKKARAGAALSQRALSVKTDLDVAVISRLERGLHTPTINTLTKLAKGIGIPVGKLMP